MNICTLMVSLLTKLCSVISMLLRTHKQIPARPKIYKKKRKGTLLNKKTRKYTFSPTAGLSCGFASLIRMLGCSHGLSVPDGIAVTWRVPLHRPLRWIGYAPLPCPRAAMPHPTFLPLSSDHQPCDESSCGVASLKSQPFPVFRTSRCDSVVGNWPGFRPHYSWKR